MDSCSPGSPAIGEVRPFPAYEPAERFWAKACAEAASTVVEIEADRPRNGQVIRFSVG